MEKPELCNLFAITFQFTDPVPAFALSAGGLRGKSAAR